LATKFSDKAEPHYLRAVDYENQGRIDDAIREYRMANRIKKDLIPARKRLGDLFICLGRIQDAIQQYEKAIEITSQKRKWKRILVPDEDKYSLAQVLQALAGAYEALGYHDQLIKTWSKIAHTAPVQPGDDRIISWAQSKLKSEGSSIDQ
jgi:tetratricopeptide (TPR) repeat protein